MKVLITGEKGFVGKATKEYLEKKGLKVIGYDIIDGLDLRNYEQLEEYIEKYKPDIVLHEAAIARFSDADADPKLAYEVNVLGTVNIVEVCYKFNLPLVYASTGSVYMPLVKVPITEDDPIKGNSVYGCSKATAEQYVKTLSKYIILRYAHLYGKEKVGHGLIGGFLAKINNNEQPELHGGDQTNDFTYIDDICEANYLALTAKDEAWNQAYNIGTGIELSAKEAGNILCDVVKWIGGIKVTPKRGVDPDRFAFDCSKAEKLLKFKAKVDFKEGLRNMLK